MDGKPRTVIGVMPKGFTLVPWEDGIAFWAANDLTKIPQARWMIAVGKLKPGVSLGAAQAEAASISKQILEARGEKTEKVPARAWSSSTTPSLEGPAMASPSSWAQCASSCSSPVPT